MLDILRVVNLQHFVTVMVDDLDSDLTSFRRVERPTGGGIKRVATIGVLPTVGSLIVGGKPPVRGALTVATRSYILGTHTLPEGRRLHWRALSLRYTHGHLLKSEHRRSGA